MGQRPRASINKAENSSLLSNNGDFDNYRGAGERGLKRELSQDEFGPMNGIEYFAVMLKSIAGDAKKPVSGYPQGQRGNEQKTGE
jgi:hypothetical protein